MKQQPVHSALRELQVIFTHRLRLMAMGFAIALLAISGPFGTLEYDVPVRVLYWAVVVVATYTLGQVAAIMVQESFAGRIRSRVLRAPVVALASSIPASLVVFVATYVVEPHKSPNFALLWFYVFAVSLALVAVIMALTPTDNTVSVETSPPALLERLPHAMRGRLVHLEVSDHYVDVTTDKGTSLVLIRLSDAIRETSPLAGLQVHRSHWVALDAVRQPVRANGKLFLELETGQRVPVSRSYTDAVRAAGLLH